MVRSRLVLAGAALLAVIAGGYRSIHTPTPLLDLLEGPTDSNGFLINPRWAAAPDSGSPPPDVAVRCHYFVQDHPDQPGFLGGCTSQAESIELVYTTFLKSAVLCKPYRRVTHANWRHSAFPLDSSATVVTGRVSFLGHEDGLIADDDVDLLLLTPGDPGRTADDPVDRATGHRLLEIEFQLSEVRKSWRGGLWKSFGELIQAANDSANKYKRAADYSRVAHLIDGRFVVAMGIFGVDAVHGAHSELHPALSIAVRDEAPDRFRDHWEVFARNSGNEGMCSKGVQQLARSTVDLWLPWRTGASKAEVRVHPYPPASWPPMVFTFTHAPIAIPIAFGASGARRVFSGEIEVVWNVSSTEPIIGTAPAFTEAEASPEAALTRLAPSLSPEARARLRRAGTQAQAVDKSFMSMRVERAPTQAEEAVSRERADSARLRELCRIFNDSIPDLGRCPIP